MVVRVPGILGILEICWHVLVYVTANAPKVTDLKVFGAASGGAGGRARVYVSFTAMLVRKSSKNSFAVGQVRDVGLVRVCVHVINSGAFTCRAGHKW